MEWKTRIDPSLAAYIESAVFPEYALNDPGHGLEHILYVIDRSMRFAQNVPDVDYGMVCTVAACHDIAHHIDAKRHEALSAQWLLQNEGLRRFFSAEQLQTMADAIFDHRSTLKGEPRSVYGKLVSSADRGTDVDTAIWRSYQYRLAHNPGHSLEENMRESRRHLIDKFGADGYAVHRMYFPDPDYDAFLREIAEVTADEAVFAKRFAEVVTKSARN